MVTRVKVSDQIAGQQKKIQEEGTAGMAVANKAHAEKTGAVSSVGSGIASVGGLIPGPVGAGMKIGGTALSLGAGVAGASRHGVTGPEAVGLTASAAGAVASSKGAIDNAGGGAPKEAPAASKPAKHTLDAAAEKAGRGSAQKPIR